MTQKGHFIKEIYQFTASKLETEHKKKEMIHHEYIVKGNELA